LFRLLHGHVLDKLAELPDASIHCVVTSPPYFGLRDYKIPPVNWPAVEFIPMAGLPSVSVPAMRCVHGLESDPLTYVAHEVLIFREVRRVLREDGVLWLNLGDSFASNTGANGGHQGSTGQRANRRFTCDTKADSKVPANLKPKDQIGIPWRVAFALQADGWYLRMDNIWHKPNPMPESVTDRPTKAHEYVFLLTKSATYFYDAEAVKEPVTGGAHAKIPGNVREPKGAQAYANGDHRQRTKAGLLAYAKRKRAEAGSGIKNNDSMEDGITGYMVSNRNKRSVWTIATESFKGAHFATFPKALVLPCILAGTSARGCCAKCGAPWERIVANGKPDLAHQRACGGDANGDYFGKSTKDYSTAKAQDASATKARILAGMVEKKTVGWKPTCKCEETKTVPCTVLDPFIGSGTTAEVALEHGRDCIGIELSTEYLAFIKDRANVAPVLRLA
jgi:DNA modification methylase